MLNFQINFDSYILKDWGYIFSSMDGIGNLHVVGFPTLGLLLTLGLEMSCLHTCLGKLYALLGFRTFKGAHFWWCVKMGTICHDLEAIYKIIKFTQHYVPKSLTLPLAQAKTSDQHFWKKKFRQPMGRFNMHS